MPRKYSHIQEHEKEIIELRSQGMTLRQIVSASRDPVLDNRKKDRLKPVP